MPIYTKLPCSYLRAGYHASQSYMTVLYTPHKACCVNFDRIQEIEPKVGVGALSQIGVLSLDYNNTAFTRT